MQEWVCSGCGMRWSEGSGWSAPCPRGRPHGWPCHVGSGSALLLPSLSPYVTWPNKASLWSKGNGPCLWKVIVLGQLWACAVMDDMPLFWKQGGIFKRPIQGVLLSNRTVSKVVCASHLSLRFGPQTLRKRAVFLTPTLSAAPAVPSCLRHAARRPPVPAGGEAPGGAAFSFNRVLSTPFCSEQGEERDFKQPG